VGQWTDDASMGLCLADSLICCNGFNAIDLRRRFHLWWNYGYCNAFGRDDKRGDKGSVGLGGNISLSLKEFANCIGKSQPPEETQKGDVNTSGNGSIMRNAAIPIYYKDNLHEALTYASKQSKTTHQGFEAYECCRLLTFIVIKALKHPGVTAKEILENLNEFEADTETVKHSKDEPVSIVLLARSTKTANPDQNWDWKHSTFQYSPTRARQQPGYIGSYAMDAMAMSLHCIYYTNTFEDALMKCANYRGDSDSVCAVTGQIAGAIYGWKQINPLWTEKILKWDKDDFILLRGYKLFYRHPKVYQNEIINVHNANEVITNSTVQNIDQNPQNRIEITNSTVQNIDQNPQNPIELTNITAQIRLDQKLEKNDVAPVVEKEEKDIISKQV
jgi:ADP-ribosylglycohydrolase